MLGKLPVPGRPTNLDYSRAWAYCACSRCGWGGLVIFSFIYHFSFLSPSLWETAPYRLKYCLKGPLSPIQPTNQPSAVTCMKIKLQSIAKRLYLDGWMNDLQFYVLFKSISVKSGR